MTRLEIWRESASLILAAKSVFAKTKFDYKILSLKRSSKAKFMPKLYVFPGGNICNSDKSLTWYKLFENFGFNKQSFNDLRLVENAPLIFQHEENALPKYLSLRICAIRETFEECGILLCRSPKMIADCRWASFIGGRELLSWQHKVHDNPEEFQNLCKRFNIFPDVWALKNWSNWKTPSSYKELKFDTIFFLTTLSQRPFVQGDKKEIADLMWETPHGFLQMNTEDRVQLALPQFYELSRIRTFSNIEDLSDFATKRNQYGFETFWPYRVKTKDGVYSILPGDDLYSVDKCLKNQEIPYLENIAPCEKKHRILHKVENSHLLEIRNFSLKDHIVPINETLN